MAEEDKQLEEVLDTPKALLSKIIESEDLVEPLTDYMTDEVEGIYEKIEEGEKQINLLQTRAQMLSNAAKGLVELGSLYVQRRYDEKEFDEMAAKIAINLSVCDIKDPEKIIARIKSTLTYLRDHSENEIIEKWIVNTAKKDEDQTSYIS